MVEKNLSVVGPMPRGVRESGNPLEISVQKFSINVSSLILYIIYNFFV